MTVRIFIFTSEASPDLRGFNGDLGGEGLPDQLKPCRAIGSVAPDRDPPHNLSRNTIETAIKNDGFQLWRCSKKRASQKS